MAGEANAEMMFIPQFRLEPSRPRQPAGMGNFSGSFHYDLNEEWIAKKPSLRIVGLPGAAIGARFGWGGEKHADHGFDPTARRKERLLLRSAEVWPGDQL